MCSKIFVRIHPVLMMLWAKMCKSPMGPMAHVPHGPCTLLPMWPIPCPYPLYPIPLYPLWPIAHVLHTPCTPYPCGSHCPCALYPCTPLPPVSSLPLGPIAHVTHTPCTPLPSLPRWPIAQWGTGVMGNGAIA